MDDIVPHNSASNERLICLDGSIGNYKPIGISVVHNPSHLEVANPVAMGKAYAKIQDYDNNTHKVFNIIIHGDAALSAQGVIYENLSFHRLPGYDVGGSIHIVINNQIGFTTEKGRSSLYW